MSRVPAIDVVLRDGSTARVRPAGRGDVAVLRDFLERLEPAARWFRFFSAGVNLERAARSAVTPQDGRALLVLTGEDERVVGHAMYARSGPDDTEAELAFAVAADWQGRGLATTLLAHLAETAAADGISTFVAITLPDNHRMIGVFRDSGFPVEVRAQPGELQVRFPCSLTPAGRRRFEERERDAAIAAVAHVLRPSSVLVAASGAQPGTAGGEALRNLAGAGFTGTLHAVLDSGETPGGIATAGTIADVPGDVELAVLALAPDGVIRAARACARRGDVRALVVLLEGSGPIDTDQLVADLSRRRDAPARAGMPRRGQHRPRRRARRHLRSHAAHPGSRRVRRTERWLWDRRAGSGRAARRGPVVVRLDGRQGGPVGQRPAAVLGGRSRHRGGAALPGVVRQPAPFRAGRPPPERAQACDRGQERPRPGGAARRRVAGVPCWRARTRTSTRSSATRACSGRTPWRRCSTSPGCWPASRCHPATASRS